MAFQRDYILRMIEQIGQALIRLRKLITGEAASPDEVDGELRSTARAIGVDLDLARLATGDTLVMLVSDAGAVDPMRCWLLAETLFLDGLAADTAQDAGRARLSYEKALQLFALIRPKGAFLVGWPEAAERMEEIEGRLAMLDGDTG